MKKRTPTTWKKGQSGNPKGRPKKGKCITELLREALELKPAGSKERYIDLLIKVVLRKALQGDVTLIKEIINRIDGLPVQRVKMGDLEDGLTIRYIAADPNKRKNGKNNSDK